MRLSPLAGGRYWAAVEQFGAALCLWLAADVPEWIVSRGKNGQWAAILDLGAGGLAGGLGNAAQRIVNLLFARRNALIFNVCGSHYLGCMVARVQIGGGVGAFDRGGGGQRRALAAASLIHRRLQNIFTLPEGLKIRLQKKGGARAVSHKNQHSTQL
jgi:hypothetical protein